VDGLGASLRPSLKNWRFCGAGVAFDPFETPLGRQRDVRGCWGLDPPLLKTGAKSLSSIFSYYFSSFPYEKERLEGSAEEKK
jgi:hypothetical protein